MDDDDYGNQMDYDAYNDDDDEQSPQTQTQSTQAASQPYSQGPPPNDVDSHIWGYLQPCNERLVRIDFLRPMNEYTIGRNQTENVIILPGFKVSGTHCVITWDGTDKPESVTVIDKSSNGTFINGQKIGRGNTRILREGCEIAFGQPSPQPNNPQEDYRFIYRHTANGPPKTGLYAFYDIAHELGKGSFATVMKALNRQTGIWYAVKMIKSKKVTQQEGLPPNQAILREVTIMEKLKHPNICELKEIFIEADTGDINLVLELVEGGDLLEYILSRGGLGEVDTKNITYQICSALSYIHSKGIAHRDLKPENVLLTKSNPPKVKIADFGLAKIADSLTMLRTMCGTPSYLAPEVVKQQNQEGYDNAVDSWSVGVIVFSMLTNASPFIEDETQRDVRLRIAERKIEWSVLESRDVSPECQQFIRSLLQEDPKQRMSLTNALEHPWLKSHIPVHTASDDKLLAAASSSGVGAPGPSAGVTHQFVGLQIQGPQREASRGAPLQRRSHVLSQAAEEGRAVPEPTPEMIAREAARDTDREQSKRNKRVRANLTPLEEESDNAAAPSSNAESSSSGSGTAKAPKRPRLRSDNN